MIPEVTVAAVIAGNLLALTLPATIRLGFALGNMLDELIEKKLEAIKHGSTNKHAG